MNFCQLGGGGSVVVGRWCWVGGGLVCGLFGLFQTFGLFLGLSRIFWMYRKCSVFSGFHRLFSSFFLLNHKKKMSRKSCALMPEFSLPCDDLSAVPSVLRRSSRGFGRLVAGSGSGALVVRRPAHCTDLGSRVQRILPRPSSLRTTSDTRLSPGWPTPHSSSGPSGCAPSPPSPWGGPTGVVRRGAGSWGRGGCWQ
jgi:hypothetical protein